MPEMDLRSLKSLLASEKTDALAAFSASELSDDRAKALEYYNGDMGRDLPSLEGRSSAVSSDVADTVEGIMPQLMEIFCGSDDVVRLDPVGPEDVEAAEQESDYVNHVFMQENQGFMVLYSFMKDGLLQKNGVAKVWWDTHEQEERETYYDQSDDSFALIAQAALNGEYEIAEHTAKETPIEGQVNPETGEPAVVVSHDVTLIKTKKYAQAKVLGVPPEEFGIERNARSIRDCNYCFHDVLRTESQLIEQGYDEDQVKALTPYVGNTNTETLARDTVGESSGTGSDSSNPSTRILRVTEHYIRMDYEGKGRACLYRVTTAGDGEILTRDGDPDIVPIDVIPFAAWTPIPVTHRFYGKSLADLVMEIQKIKTALIRGGLDNLYMQISPRVEVAESHVTDNTLDDLLVARPNGIVRTKTPGGINWQRVPDVTGAIYPALEYFDATREWRSGVTRQGQGIDAQALQNQSATAVNQAFTMAQARIKFIARILAETGLRDLFSLLHGTIRKHGQEAKTVRLRNKWVKVDPRNWKTRSDMTINVGLGNGGKAEQVAQLTMLMNVQKECLAGGLVQLIQPKNIYNSFKRFVELTGLKDVTPYMTDPDSPEGKQAAAEQAQKPDPKMAELQMKNEIEKTQAQADIATQRQKTEAEIARDDRKTQQELATKEAEHRMRMQELTMNMVGKFAGHFTQPVVGADGVTVTEQPDLNAILAMIDRLQPKQSAVRFVRDETGRLAGMEPLVN